MSYQEAISRIMKLGLLPSEAELALANALQRAKVETIDALLDYALHTPLVEIRDRLGTSFRIVMSLIDDDNPGSGVREPRRPIRPRAGCALELDIPVNQEDRILE